MERIEVFRIEPEFDNSKCYEYAEATKKEGDYRNRRYYTDKQPLYVGHLVGREQGGFGDGGWRIDTFEDDTGKKHIVNYSNDRDTCFREVHCKSVRSLQSLARAVVKKNYEYLSLPKDDVLRVLIEGGSLPQYNPEEESFYRQQSASNGWSGAGTSRGAGGVDTTAGVSGTSNTGGGAGPSENGAADSKKDFKGGRRSNKTKSTKKTKRSKKTKSSKKTKITKKPKRSNKTKRNNKSRNAKGSFFSKCIDNEHDSISSILPSSYSSSSTTSPDTRLARFETMLTLENRKTYSPKTSKVDKFTQNSIPDPDRKEIKARIQEARKKEKDRKRKNRAKTF